MSHQLTASLGLTESGDLELLKRQIHEQQIQISQLVADKALGNLFYGGVIKTAISTSPFSTGPFIYPLDSTHDVDFTIWVPDYLLRILRIQFRLRPVPIRLAATAATVSGDLVSLAGGGSTSGSGGGQTSTSVGTPSGGSQTSSSVSTPSGGGSTSGAGSSHSHDINGETVNASSHSHPASAVLVTGGQTDTANAFDGHSHFVTGGLTGGVSSGGSHSHDIDGVTSASESTHSHSTPAHTHPAHAHDVIDHTHASHAHQVSDHQHSTPAHQHTTPSHGHTLTPGGIVDGGNATDLHVWIDGVDRTADLGGPWNAPVTLDVTRYFLDSRNMPEIGDHPIKIESATVGAIELFQDWYVIAKPAGR